MVIVFPHLSHFTPPCCSTIKRNTDTVDLNGDSGDDTFVVRSFIALVIDVNGEILGSDSKKVTAFGGDDEDNFEVQREAPKNENEPDQELFKSRGEDPDYVVNSLVSSSCCLQPSIVLRFLCLRECTLCLFFLYFAGRH